MRFKILHIIIIILFLVAFFGLVYTQIFKGSFYYRLSKNNCIRIIPQEARRGLILDRSGTVLADNRISFNLALIPQELSDKEEVWQYLSKTLGKSRSILEREYKKNKSLPFVPAVTVKGIEKHQAIILEQKKPDLPGVIIETGAERFYPQGEVTCHVLGYVREIDQRRITRLRDYGYKVKDIVGYSGVEEFYDGYLRGQEGGTQFEVDNRGRSVRIIADRLAKKGQDITLTLDLRIQKIAARLLEGRRGAIIVIDPGNGEILAMVSSPSFDPGIFIGRSSQERIADLLGNRNYPLLNRAIAGLYSLGSVFKAVVAVAALASQKINSNTSFLCTGKLSAGQREFNCWSKHGNQDIEEALAHSCNVFFYHLGLLAGVDLLNKYALEFGFGNPSGIDLPSEARGKVPSRAQKRLSQREPWYQGDTLNFSIGQGDLLVTPLQAVRAMAVLANNGVLVRPHLLKAIEGKVVNGRQNFARINIKSDILRKVKSYLREVVRSPTGTASILNMENLSVAGKTGTVQTGRNARQHAWFVGFCPFEKPKFVFCVFLEHGGYSSESCVIAKEMLQEMLKENLF